METTGILGTLDWKTGYGNTGPGGMGGLIETERLNVRWCKRVV